jgi:hypothetical protein
VRQSWRTIVLSRGKQGAKAMREFYRDLHKAHPELEEKVGKNERKGGMKGGRFACSSCVGREAGLGCLLWLHFYR